MLAALGCMLRWMCTFRYLNSKYERDRSMWSDESEFTVLLERVSLFGHWIWGSGMEGDDSVDRIRRRISVLVLCNLERRA